MSVAPIYDSVRQDFELVNALITQHLFSQVPLVEKSATISWTVAVNECGLCWCCWSAMP